MKTITEDLVLIQTRETLKQFSVQSDADFFMIKELRMKVQSLQAELKNLNQMYKQSVRDREFLATKVIDLKNEITSKGTSRHEAKIKSLEKKNEEVLRDFMLINRLVRSYMAIFDAKTKTDLMQILKIFKSKYE